VKYIKSGIVLGNSNPVLDGLFIKNGWIPVIENKTVEVAEETVEDSQKDIVSESPTIYKKGDFTTMSKEKIVELAESLGYTITATKKADMIEEFLAQQN
jgi:hypothetical protein